MNAAMPPVRVLLADDDAAYLASLAPLVEEVPELTVAGTAANGVEALECTDRLHPDAVVIDLHMPLLDGVASLSRLRRDHPHLCLIALTGDDSPALHRAAREAGADAVILKSDLLGDLMERLAGARSR